MKHTINKTLYQYWNELRGDRMAPKRFEIEPSEIAGLLPHAFMLERLDIENMKFRLAGTKMCEQFGREFRGANFLDLWNDADRLTFQRQFSVMSRHGAVGIFEFEADAPGLARPAQIELLLLPLTHTRETIDRYLGAISMDHGSAAFSAGPFTIKRITDHDLVWPDGRPHQMIDSKARQTPFLPQLRKARLVNVDRRQFRVYDGGLTETKRDDT